MLTDIPRKHRDMLPPSAVLLGGRYNPTISSSLPSPLWIQRDRKKLSLTQQGLETTQETQKKGIFKLHLRSRQRPHPHCCLGTAAHTQGGHLSL